MYLSFPRCFGNFLSQACVNVKLAQGVDIPEEHGKASPRMNEDASSMLVLRLNTALNFGKYFSNISQNTSQKVSGAVQPASQSFPGCSHKNIGKGFTQVQ